MANSHVATLNSHVATLNSHVATLNSHVGKLILFISYIYYILYNNETTYHS